MESLLKILAGFLFMGAVYSFVILQQTSDSGSERYVPMVAMVCGALICSIFSIGGKSKYDATYKKNLLWKIIFLLIVCAGFASFWFLYGNKQ